MMWIICGNFSSLQSSTEALIAATSYLDLFLRSITDANLMKVFLEFILVERCDGMSILDLLVSRIAHESQVKLILPLTFGLT